MGTGMMLMNTEFLRPRSPPKSHARARHPPRARNHARTRDPRIFHARGHTRARQTHPQSLSHQYIWLNRGTNLRSKSLHSGANRGCHCNCMSTNNTNQHTSLEESSPIVNRNQNQLSIEVNS
jgi:hypothetical protein